METEAIKGSESPNTLTPAIFGRRPFAVRALTVLIFLQAIIFLGLGLATTDWRQPLPSFILDQAPQLAFMVMGLLNLISAAGFLRLRPAAWLMAMFVQGTYLLLALVLYLVNRPDDYLFYGLMTLSVIIVVYLNYAEVPTLFLRWRSHDNSSRLTAQNLGYYEDFPD
jgi:hypothetical protein